MTEPPMGMAGVGGAVQPPGSCTIASNCFDIEMGLLPTRACCTPAYSCGYELPQLDPETMMWFPDTKDFFAMLTKDDPNGRCAPDSFLFGPHEGLAEERWEQAGSPDILIAPGCTSYHLAAFSVMGCCLPDNRCGLSTHANYDTFAVVANDPNAPFARPECVAAEVLNEQFRAAGLRAFARTTSSGVCNYAEIEARQPNLMP